MNRSQRHSDIMPMLLSKLLGCWFLCSSLLKFFALKSFEAVVQSFLEAYFASFLLGYSQALSVAISLFEFVIGLCALAAFKRKALSVVFSTTLGFFTCLTGINLFFPSLMGSIESCGCFGELIHFTPLASFIKCVIMLIMSVVWLCMEFGKKDKKEE